MAASDVMISASILSANFACLADEVSAACDAGVDALHIDVMDRHFVPNLSFGHLPVQALREAGVTAEMDVHLMVTNPLAYVDDFARAGATRLSFHPETVICPSRVVERIAASGMKVGLVFNPDRQVDIDPSLLPCVDLLLLMTVYPGFGGQTLMPELLPKISQTQQWLAQCRSDAWLAVDGGVNVASIASVVASGARYCVVGSALFGAEDIRLRVQQLRQAISEGLSCAVTS